MNVELQYLDSLKALADKSAKEFDLDKVTINRTMYPASKMWVSMLRHEAADGFPLLTTKRVYWKAVVAELVGFLAGYTNAKNFRALGANIWDEWELKEDYYTSEMINPQDRLIALANKLGVGISVAYERLQQADAKHGYPLGSNMLYEDNGVELENRIIYKHAGELGPIYGARWRNFNGVDQILDLLTNLIANPMSRRHLVTAWDPSVLPDETETHRANVINNKQVLPPCHYAFQFDVELDASGKPTLNSVFNMRSADWFLGVPFNIASYTLLQHLTAKEIAFDVGTSVGVFNNYHLYHNALGAASEQTNRKPKTLPQLHLHPDVSLRKIIDAKGSTTDQTLEMLKGQVDLIVNSLSGYEPHPSLKVEVAV